MSVPPLILGKSCIGILFFVRACFKLCFLQALIVRIINRRYPLKRSFPLPIRNQQSHHFRIVFPTALYLVSFQIEVIYPILYRSCHRTVFRCPIRLIVFCQFNYFRADTFRQLSVFFPRQQPACVSQYMAEYGKIAGKTNIHCLGCPADAPVREHKWPDS